MATQQHEESDENDEEDFNDEDEEALKAAEAYQSIVHLPKIAKNRRKPVPWTQEEESFLIKLICKHGPKWSNFETQYAAGDGDKPLRGRNQTALKDKARNIMRNLIENGGPNAERKWKARFPMWSLVSVGAARRGVHAYEGDPPDRPWKRSQISLDD
jgi:hypothetical protein